MELHRLQIVPYYWRSLQSEPILLLIKRAFDGTKNDRKYLLTVNSGWFLARGFSSFVSAGEGSLCIDSEVPSAETSLPWPSPSGEMDEA